MIYIQCIFFQGILKIHPKQSILLQKLLNFVQANMHNFLNPHVLFILLSHPSQDLEALALAL